MPFGKLVQRRLVKLRKQIVFYPRGVKKNTLKRPGAFSGKFPCDTKGCRHLEREIALRTIHSRAIRKYTGVTHGAGNRPQFKLALLTDDIAKKRHRAIFGNRRLEFFVPLRVFDVIRIYDGVVKDGRFKYPFTSFQPVLSGLETR